MIGAQVLEWLDQRFTAHLDRQGYTTSRLRIRPAGEAKPLFSDVYIPELNLLVEAKGTVSRPSVRMAIGQLADYVRFAPRDCECAMLLPSRPREDLVALIRSARLTLIWECEGGFEQEAPDGSKAAILRSS